MHRKRAGVMAERVVELARGWIGTPYLHQGSRCGIGADCLGLVRGVWRQIYGSEPELPPAYTADWGECRGGEILRAAMARHFAEVQGEFAPGQVLLFRMRRGAVAKHLGIMSGATGFIHAYSGHGVVESRLSAAWRGRVIARFGFPLSDATTS